MAQDLSLETLLYMTRVTNADLQKERAELDYEVHRLKLHLQSLQCDYDILTTQRNKALKENRQLKKELSIRGKLTGGQQSPSKST